MIFARISLGDEQTKDATLPPETDRERVITQLRFLGGSLQGIPIRNSLGPSCDHLRLVRDTCEKLLESMHSLQDFEPIWLLPRAGDRNAFARLEKDAARLSDCAKNVLQTLESGMRSSPRRGPAGPDPVALQLMCVISNIWEKETGRPFVRSSKRNSPVDFVRAVFSSFRPDIGAGTRDALMRKVVALRRKGEWPSMEELSIKGY